MRTNLLRCFAASSACFVIILSVLGRGVCNQGARSEPSSPLAQAHSSLERGNPEEAIQTLSSYLQNYPRDTSVRMLLGEAFAIAGQSDRAEAEFQRVLQITPNNYFALAALAGLHDRAGHPEKAEPMLARAVKLSHGTRQTRTQWAAVLARLHRYKEAESALAGLPPPSSREERIAFYRLKGSVALGLGNPSAAAAEMEKALLLKPNDVGLNVATAAAEVHSNNWQRAARLVGPAYSLNHDPGIGLVLLEAQLGGSDDVKQTLESLRATSLPPEETAALHQRIAEVLTTYGQFSESIEDFKKAAELEPERADLAFNLALAQFKAGHLGEALVSADKCREVGDSADLEDLLGDIQEGRGDNLAAVRSYQAAVALAPAEEKYRVSLAVELIRHKSFEAAKVVLKQAEELLPSSWRIQLALGMVEFFAGSDEQASRILVHAADLAPEPFTALGYLGDIQMDQAAVPDPVALDRLCQYADHHPKEGKMQFYCGALTLKRDYTSGDRAHIDDIVRRLQAAANLLPKDNAPSHCELGKIYSWVEQWARARQEMEVCARMDTDLAESHYHLAKIYQHIGQPERARQEMKLYDAAAQRQADENARRDETMKTFLYKIQNIPHR